jgi:hypothetical protein
VRYLRPVERGSLSDPEFEPSDQELTELAHRAFADVGAQRRESLRKLYEQIDQARAEVLRSLAGGS